jgi:hypothetical protein
MTMSKQIYLQKLLKVMFVTIMLALVSNNYAGGGSEGSETVPKKLSLIAHDGCPGKWINICLNNAPVRYIFEFVFFQYGKTVRMKYGFEGTYGISNGIAWAPKFLAFNKYFKMALGDFSINLVNILFDAIRILPFKIFENKAGYFIKLLMGNIAINFHLLAFKFAQFLKLKLFSLGGIAFAIGSLYKKDSDLIGNTIDIFWWLDNDDKANRLSALFLILSPRLTFDISEFISFISADKS